jgi:Tol biopolymer transport system component
VSIRCATLFIASWSFANLCAGEDLIADIRQGTNMALALAPDGETIVVDLVGQLWELPATGGAATALTPIDEPARNPRFSPDGEAVVYQRSTAGQWDLWLLELASGARRRLTGPPANEREPDFSPDGKSVIFASDRAGSYDIWELDLDSGELSQRSRSAAQASFPTVSERGDIAYVNQRADDWSLDVLRPDGTSLVLLEVPYPLHAPSWRTGGGVILFTAQPGPAISELKMIVLSREPVVRTLTKGEDVFGFRAAWRSPDEYLYTADGRIWKRTLGNAARSPVELFAGVGVTRASHALRSSGHAPVGPQRVQGIRAVRASSSGRSWAFTALGDLWLQDADGDLRQLTNDVYLDIDPAFGPEDDFLVFASDRAGDMDLWQLSLDTDELSRVTSERGKAYRPTVSPDGTQVAFLRTQGFGPWSDSSLELLRLAPGQRARTLADGLSDASTPVWDHDGMGITVTTTQVSADPGRQAGPGTLHVDLATGAARWSPKNAPGEPESAPVPDPRTAMADPMIDWMPTEPAHHYVVQVDRLFDGVRTQYRRHMDIHVKNGRIIDLVARGLSPLPETVIDARDYTIIPGLIDIHVHQSALSGERIGRIWLAYGVTTVREVNSEPGDGMERREAWASGQRLGPRLLLTSAEADLATGVRSVSTRPAYDVLELYSGQPERFSSAIQKAKLLGLPVFSDSLFPATRFGINGLEHIGGRSEQPYGLERSLLGKSYQDVLSILTQTRTVVTPTLAAFGGFSRLAAEQRLWSAEAAYAEFYHAYERAGWQERLGRERVMSLQQTIAELVRAGGLVTAGSDAPAVPYGLGLHAELALLREAGLANDQVLRLATATAALALGLERDLGTLEVGKLADFVVLTGDPLTRIADSLRIEAVVKGGVWLERQELMISP